MGETGTLFRDLGRNFKVTSCDVAIIWPDKCLLNNGVKPASLEFHMNMFHLYN